MTGPRLFSIGELDRLESTQQGAMNDTCQVLTAAESQTAYGEVSRSWSVSSTSPCGFNPLTDLQRGKEVERADSTVLNTDAELRLPAGTTVAADDRIKVTYRLGVLQASPLTYEIVGPVKTGPSGIVLSLRRVTLE